MFCPIRHQKNLKDEIRARKKATQERNQIQIGQQKAKEIRESGMACYYDLDNCLPEPITGHSWDCRIHKAVMKPDDRRTRKERQKMIIIRVKSDFSLTPGPRYESEGKNSGEQFRRELLVKNIKDMQLSKGKITVDLDGTAGYGCAFLDEAFGGLIRVEGLDYHQLKNTLSFISIDEPNLIKEIDEYMKDAAGLQMSKTPFTPQEARKRAGLDNHLPSEVIEAFEECIVKNLEGEQAQFNQNEVVRLILDKMPQVTRKEVFDNNWLDVEEAFKETGWTVEYTNPGYNREYITFTFKENHSTQRKIQQGLPPATQPREKYVPPERKWEKTYTMLMIDRKSYKCEYEYNGKQCCCNVFRKQINGNGYKCNACGTLYEGEKNKTD